MGGGGVISIKTQRRLVVRIIIDMASGADGSSSSPCCRSSCSSTDVAIDEDEEEMEVGPCVRGDTAYEQGAFHRKTLRQRKRAEIINTKLFPKDKTDEDNDDDRKKITPVKRRRRHQQQQHRRRQELHRRRRRHISTTSSSSSSSSRSRSRSNSKKSSSSSSSSSSSRSSSSDRRIRYRTGRDTRTVVTVRPKKPRKIPYLLDLEAAVDDVDYDDDGIELSATPTQSDQDFVDDEEIIEIEVTTSETPTSTSGVHSYSDSTDEVGEITVSEISQITSDCDKDGFPNLNGIRTHEFIYYTCTDIFKCIGSANMLPYPMFAREENTKHMSQYTTTAWLAFNERTPGIKIRELPSLHCLQYRADGCSKVFDPLTSGTPCQVPKSIIDCNEMTQCAKVAKYFDFLINSKAVRGVILYFQYCSVIPGVDVSESDGWDIRLMTESYGVAFVWAFFSIALRLSLDEFSEQRAKITQLDKTGSKRKYIWTALAGYRALPPPPPPILQKNVYLHPLRETHNRARGKKEKFF